MHDSPRAPQPPRRDARRSQLWRWFWRGLVFWLLLAAVATFLFAGSVAPVYREARHLLVGITSAASAREPNTANFVPIAHTSENPFGINTFLYQEVEEEKIKRSLALIKEAGFGFVREQVAWQEFERGQKGNYTDERWNRPTWDNLDRLVRLVNEAGLQLIARVDYPPDWALPPGTTWHAAPPARFEDYGDFLFTLATRYRGQLKYYQVWNEPNLTIEWGMRNVDPAEYVRLLKVAYARLKEADPENVVVAAALAPTIEKGPQNMNDLAFLRRMYEAGAKDYFDIASVNPYGLRSGPDDRRYADEDTNFSRPIRAREIMVEFGDAAKPIWASETGWNALPVDFPLSPLYGRATRDQQARYTVRAYERVLQEWPWLGTMSLWHFRMVDDRLATQQPYYFGVVGDDFTPMPVYGALASLATQPATIYPGYRQEDHRAIVYEGAWQAVRDDRASLGRVVVADQPGAKARFRFWGTGLTLVAGQGKAGGKVGVTIDRRGSQANILPKGPDGTARLESSASPQAWQAQIPVARGLAPGVHEAELTVLEGPFALDGVVVYSERLAAPSAVPLLLALVAAIGLFAIWTRRRGGKA